MSLLALFDSLFLLLGGIALIAFGFWFDSTFFLRGIMRAVAIRAKEKMAAINLGRKE